MSGIQVTVKGMDKVLATLKTLTDGDKLTDEAVRKTALNSLSDLVRNSVSKNPKISGMNTGNTARSWTSPLKIAIGSYRVTNSAKTRDGRHSVVKILDEGHGEITPKRKYLYIPLNKKAAMKKPGADIPTDLVRGEDFVFAKRIKPLAGRNFIDRNIKAAQAELKSRLLAAIKGAIK